MPIAGIMDTNQQISMTEHPDVLVLEIGHSTATDLATKVISKNLIPQIQSENQSNLSRLVPRSNEFGTILLSSNSYSNSKVKFSTIKVMETPLASLKNSLTNFKPILLIVVSHGLENGTGISDGINTIQYRKLVPVLASHSEYTFFASCNSTSVNSINSRFEGLPGIVDATVAGIIASAWAYNSFGLVKQAKLLISNLFKEHFNLIVNPVNPLDYFSVNFPVESLVFLAVAIQQLIFMGLYEGLQVSGWQSAIISLIINWLADTFFWPWAKTLPIVGSIISYFSWAKGTITTAFAAVVSGLITALIDIVTGGSESLVSDIGYSSFAAIMGNVLWGYITNSNLAEFYSMFRSVIVWGFNLAGEMLGTNGFGTFLDEMGAFAGTLTSVAELRALQSIMQGFFSGENPLGDIIGGAIVGQLALEMSDNLLHAVDSVINLFTRYIHIGISIGFTYFWGIPNGYYFNPTFSIDPLY